MGFEQHHKIEQPRPQGDHVHSSAAHDEVFRSMSSPENRPKPTPVSDTQFPQMTDPFKTSDANNHSGFPGAEQNLPTKKDPGIHTEPMRTQGQPLSDSNFQLMPTTPTEDIPMS